MVDTLRLERATVPSPDEKVTHTLWIASYKFNALSDVEVRLEVTPEAAAGEACIYCFEKTGQVFQIGPMNGRGVWVHPGVCTDMIKRAAGIEH